MTSMSKFILFITLITRINSDKFTKMERKLEQLIATYRTHLDCCKRQLKINVESASSKAEWSDMKLKEIASRIKFPKAVFDLHNLRSIIIQFFNFYFTGKISSNSTAQSIVFSAISLLNIPDNHGSYKRVFDEEEYMEREYRKPFYKWMIDSHSHSLEMCDKGINRFKMEVQSILNSWDVSKTWTNENQAKLMRLTAFLALSLCRSVGNEEIQLGIDFRSKEYRKILSDSVGWKENQPFQSASLESLKKCKYQLNNEFFLTKRIFALVIKHWLFAEQIYWDVEEEEIEKLKALLYKSLLESVEGHGMTIILLLLTICKITGTTYREIKEIINTVGCNFTSSPDWQEVKQFYKRYLRKENHQTSVMWAKLVDDAYFSEYFVQLNEKDWALLITILELKEKPQNWKDTWNKEFLRITSRAKKLGMITHRKLMDKETEDDLKRELEAANNLKDADLNENCIGRPKTGWNDDTLEDIASMQKFPRQVFDSRNVKLILARFFYFYETGKLSRNSSLQCTVFSPIAVLNIPDTDGRYKRVFSEVYMERRDIKPFYKWDNSFETFSLNALDSRDRFIQVIQKMLESWNERRIWTGARQVQLMRLAAFLALTICRVIVQDDDALLDIFRNKNYRRSLSACVGWQMALPYTPPSKECLRRCKIELTRSFNILLSPIFAITVRHWSVSKKVQLDDYASKALLYDSLLESTKGFEMGLINRLLGVLEYTKQPFEKLMAVLLSVEPKVKTFPGWESLKKFHTEVLCEPDAKQYSFHWARTIDQCYYAECSPKSSALLCSVFDSILEFNGQSQKKARGAQEEQDFTSLTGKEIGQKVRRILMGEGIERKVETRSN